MELQGRIKILREEKELTQKELATYLNVDRATISGYETKGKHPDLDKLIKLATLFGVSLDYLICGSSPKSEQDFIESSQNEDLIDAKIYNIYSQLQYNDKKDLERYIQFLFYKHVRPEGGIE